MKCDSIILLMNFIEYVYDEYPTDNNNNNEKTIETINELKV